MTDIGRSPDGSSHSAEPEPSCTVSAVPVSVSNAVEKLRANAEGLKAYFDSFYEAKREAHDSMFGRPYGVEEKAADVMLLVQRISVSIYQGLNDAASAIEAATAGETTKIGSTEGESAVAESETPRSNTHDN